MQVFCGLVALVFFIVAAWSKLVMQGSFDILILCSTNYLYCMQTLCVAIRIRMFMYAIGIIFDIFFKFDIATFFASSDNVFVIYGQIYVFFCFVWICDKIV